MKTKEASRTAIRDLQSSTTKAIDYLHRQFPWKNRELIASTFQEAGANLTRTLKALSRSSASTFQTQSALAN